MRIILFAVLAFVLMTIQPGTARADYFVWKDAHIRLSLSFPDTWQQVNNADPDDILTIMAPSGRGQAQCRIRVRADRRHIIYPSRFGWAIQKIDYSMGFWDDYLQEYTDPSISMMHDGAGFGRAFGSYVEASYQGIVPGPEMSRKMLGFASLYYDKAYILECSAHRDAFDQWRTSFLSIAKSIDFDKRYNEAFTGNYRNFMGDPRLILPREDEMGSMSY